LFFQRSAELARPLFFALGAGCFVDRMQAACSF